jgi:hypothetical protein
LASDRIEKADVLADPDIVSSLITVVKQEGPNAVVSYEAAFWLDLWRKYPDHCPRYRNVLTHFTAFFAIVPRGGRYGFLRQHGTVEDRLKSKYIKGTTDFTISVVRIMEWERDPGHYKIFPDRDRCDRTPCRIKFNPTPAPPSLVGPASQAKSQLSTETVVGCSTTRESIGTQRPDTMMVKKPAMRVAALDAAVPS